MKILHIVTDFSAVGGAEIMLSKLIKSQPEEEHYLVSLMGISDEIYSETLDQCSYITSLSWNGINTFAIILKLKKIIKDLKPDLIQGWMYHANILASLSLVGYKQKPKLCWGIHHSLASPKDESISTKIALFLSKILSKQPYSIIYCAYSSLEQHQQFGFSNTNQHVIANGVYLDKFQLNSGLHQPIVIGFAGRYHIAKGYPYLFEVMGLLKGQAIIFKIAGAGANLENKEVKKLFEQYQLDKTKVQLLGQVSDMPEFYNSIDVFLMTSITEGFPNVLVEAMASGLPCISTDVGDASYIVQDIGKIVPPRNTKALAEAILSYIKKTEAEKFALKLAARQRVEQNFSIEKVSEQYKAVWRV